MKKRPKLTPLDINRCSPGYYWVRFNNHVDPCGPPKIMELRKGGNWWHMGWDIPQRDMSCYEILAPVEEYKP